MIGETTEKHVSCALTNDLTLDIWLILVTSSLSDFFSRYKIFVFIDVLYLFFIAEILKKLCVQQLLYSLVL